MKLLTAGVKDLEQSICNSISTDFGSQPEAVDLAARRCLADANTSKHLKVHLLLITSSLCQSPTSHSTHMLADSNTPSGTSPVHDIIVSHDVLRHRKDHTEMVAPFQVCVH